MDLEALLRAAREGKPGAWKALYPMLSRELRRYFLREFDESIAAELSDRTVDILTDKLPVVVLRKGSLKNWVFGVAHKQGLLEHRARAQDNKALGVLAAHIVKTSNTSPTLERLAATIELVAVLHEEIKELPSRLRRVIEHDLEAAELATPDRLRSVEEFARQEGIQPGTVRSRRFQAIAMLRDRLTSRLNPSRLWPRPWPMVADSTSSSSSSSSPPG